LSPPVSLKLFQAVTRRHFQILHILRIINHDQFTQRYPLNFMRQLF
jgi:hypothetical protein